MPSVETQEARLVDESTEYATEELTLSCHSLVNESKNERMLFSSLNTF